MELLCSKKYLVFPVREGAPDRRVSFFVGGQLVYDVVTPLDFVQPEYEFFLDIERLCGERVRLECNGEPLPEMRQTDTFEADYDGELRPSAHFTARRGWINDPNGLTYYNGRYLMFYQHNPVGCRWGNMHWGLAVSNDLVHWQERDIALFADENGTMFSGSAVVDHRNVTGLKQNENDVILLFYTCAGNTSEVSQGKPFTQDLAYSTDGGESFVKYAGNPLIPQLAFENRDPKVFYHAPTDRYIMALFLEGHEFALFGSENMLEWTELSRLSLPEDWECPDLYPLMVDGETDNEHWIFSAAGDRYYIGSFDGTRFTPETPLLRLNYGNCSYAAQTWSGLGDRRVRTAFAKITPPEMPFGCCMDIPQEMSLRRMNGSLRLCAQPVQEIELLHCGVVFEGKYNAPFSCGTAGSLDITAEFAAGSSFRLVVYGLEVEYDAASSVMRCGECSAPVRGADGMVELRLIIDKIYAELFAESGSVFMGIEHTCDVGQDTLRAECGSAVELKVSRLGRYYCSDN